jgi:potassium-dependent mechanosensitive channel
VSHTSDPLQVRDLLLTIGKSHTNVLKNPEPFVLLQGFTDTAIHFELRVHLIDITKSPFVQNDLRFAIYGEFKTFGIEMAATPKDATPAALQDLNESLKKKKK